MYDHNWKFGTAQVIWLVVLIVDIAAACATATGKGYRG
jgi:predicted small secreted protein